MVHFSTHSDEKPDDHLFLKIAFEEYLKKEVCKSENFNVSALNLYKRAKKDQFNGVWLPTNHQSLFLTKLRRARNYERKEKKIVNKKNTIHSVQMKDVATTPTMPQNSILQRIIYSANKTPHDAVLNTAVVISRQNCTQASSNTDAVTSSIQSQNDTPSDLSLILRRILYSGESTVQNSLRFSSVVDSPNEITFTPCQNSTQEQQLSGTDVLIHTIGRNIEVRIYEKNMILGINENISPNVNLFSE